MGINLFSAVHRGAVLNLYRRRTLLTSGLHKHTIKDAPKACNEMG